MVFFYLVLFILVLSSMRYIGHGYNQNYLSFDTTNIIKGIFILLVFIRHVIPYISLVGYEFTAVGDVFFVWINSIIGQLLVAMFLFYSGYGIMESIKKKGNLYVSSIPRKRLLTVLLNFDVAVLIYICIRYLLGGDLNLEKCLLAFIGWESMGNSNWYIFVIMLAYAITYFSFIIFNSRAVNYRMPCIVANMILFMSMLLLSYLKESWWYDTILCFGAGLVFSNYKNQLEELMKTHYKSIFLALLLLFIFLSYLPLYLKGLKYNMLSIVFCLLVIMITLKFKMDNKVLVWMGTNLFPLYIYQRVPMIIFSSLAGGTFVANFPIAFVVSCFVITVLIAYLYKYWAIKL